VKTGKYREFVSWGQRRIICVKTRKNVVWGKTGLSYIEGLAMMTVSA
jgi:hypothetical protein